MTGISLQQDVEPEDSTCLQTEGGDERLTDTFLQYHFNSVSRAYHGTNTASFAIAIIKFNLMPIFIPCYG
jgi:hypothetical protein